MARHGELDSATAPLLRAELEGLIDADVTDITIEVRELGLCTSHGLDVFDDVHRRVSRRHGGALRLCLDGAPDAIGRVIHLIKDNDATFTPAIIEATTASPTMPAPERAGDSTS